MESADVIYKSLSRVATRKRVPETRTGNRQSLTEICGPALQRTHLGRPSGPD